MRLRHVCVYGFGTVAVAAMAACGGSQQPAPASSAPAAASSSSAGSAQVDAATAGTVAGTITVDGPVPANADIKMNADPVCAKSVTTPQKMETYMVGADGKSLGNVFVYVKEGLEGRTFDAPATAVTIDQKECRYHPHVFGIQVGQPLEILKSDPTLVKFADDSRILFRVVKRFVRSLQRRIGDGLQSHQ